jgi:site-specific DNA-methyltransferase (adenine-specific)
VTSLLVHGDALDLAAHVPPRGADLAYLDPPFAVGVQFGARSGKGARANGAVAYDDRWPSLDAYLAWLEARVRVVARLLSARGLMWLHLDHRAVHEAKIVCDRVFGRAAFLGEVVWIPGNGTKARRGPGVTHQTLLIYAAGDDWTWNGKDPALRESYAKTSLDMHFKSTDARGRRYRERTINGKTYRYYADEGRAIGSVWSDCPAMLCNTPLRRETTGYPTQKPLKLLTRIVRACTGEGGLVLDPFAGSGTTLVAAASLGRRFVGCDTSPLAIATARKRLEAEGIEFATRGARSTRNRGAPGRSRGTPSAAS